MAQTEDITVPFTPEEAYAVLGEFHRLSSRTHGAATVPGGPVDRIWSKLADASRGKLDEAEAEAARQAARRADRYDLYDRARRAYATRCRREGFSYQEPSGCPDVREIDGRTYVVLTNIRGILAVYRLKKDGHIEYVAPDYWPETLVES